MIIYRFITKTSMSNILNLINVINMKKGVILGWKEHVEIWWFLM